jgi:large subunit ribosomal protein L9
LVEDVENLGKRGEQVSVKPGFARNHLIPLRLAVYISSDNIRMVEKRRVAWLAEEAKLINELKELAGHIGKLDIKIVQKASDSGHLYGSVTEVDIATAAAGAGVAFESKHVKLDHHLKDVGDYEVLVRLHEQVEVTIPVRIRMEGNEDWVPGQELEAEAAPTEEAPEATPAD